MMKKKASNPHNLPCVDHTSGVERNPDSPLYGRLVLGTKGTPPILLWNSPGCKPTAENLTGALLHNHPVTVEKRRKYQGAWYYYISTAVNHEGTIHPQHGWVLPSVLRDIGARDGR